MKITLENCEAFFLDYHEGNLSPEMVAELLLFLEQHPQCNMLFESFASLTLHPEIQGPSFPKKEILKKQWSPAEETQLELAAWAEGDLDPAKQAYLSETYRENKSVLADVELLRRCRLETDTSIRFPHRDSLKKRSAKIYSLPSRGFWLSAAAILILLLGSGYLFKSLDPSGTNSDSQVAMKPASPTSSEMPIASPSISTPATPDPAATTLTKSFASEQRERPRNPVNLPNEKTGNKPAAISEEPLPLAAYRSISTDSANDPIYPEPQFTEAASSRLPVYIDDESPQTTADASGSEGKKTKFTLKSRIIQAAAGTIDVIGGEKVTVKTRFDPNNGNLAAYEVEAGKKKWQKHF